MAKAKYYDDRLTPDQNAELSHSYEVFQKPSIRGAFPDMTYKEFVTQILDDIASGRASWE